MVARRCDSWLLEKSRSAAMRIHLDCVWQYVHTVRSLTQKTQMPSSTVLSTQLVPFVLRAAKLDESLVEQIVMQMPDADVEKLSWLLAEVLREEADVGRMQMTNPATGQPVTLKSILFNADANSAGSVKVVAFSFSNAAQESLVAVFGLVVTAFFGQWTLGSFGSGVKVLKALWNNVSVLQSPQDDHAIAVVRALGVCRARYAEDPNNARLQKESGLAAEQLATALKQLDARKIIKNIAWGSQRGDFQHADNRWNIRF